MLQETLSGWLLIILSWKAHCGPGSEVFITYGHEYEEFPFLWEPTPVLLNPGPQDLGKPVWFISFILIFLSVFQCKA